MPSPFGDDADFPDRPDTLDFWRLSDVVLKLDGTTEDTKVEDTFPGRIDQDSLMYIADQRVSSLLKQVGPPLTMQALHAMLMAAFATGVMTGIEFERAGGHRDG